MKTCSFKVHKISSAKANSRDGYHTLAGAEMEEKRAAL